MNDVIIIIIKRRTYAGSRGVNRAQAIIPTTYYNIKNNFHNVTIVYIAGGVVLLVRGIFLVLATRVSD